MAPERRCIACRQSDKKAELLRFVWDGDTVRFDEDQLAQGRGAYVHERLRCWEKMGDVKRWIRAFRLPDKAITRNELAEVIEEIRQRVLPRENSDGGTGTRKKDNKAGTPRTPGKKIRL